MNQYSGLFHRSSRLNAAMCVRGYVTIVGVSLTIVSDFAYGPLSIADPLTEEKLDILCDSAIAFLNQASSTGLVAPRDFRAEVTAALLQAQGHFVMNRVNTKIVYVNLLVYDTSRKVTVNCGEL